MRRTTGLNINAIQCTLIYYCATGDRSEGSEPFGEGELTAKMMEGSEGKCDMLGVCVCCNLGATGLLEYLKYNYIYMCVCVHVCVDIYIHTYT